MLAQLDDAIAQSGLSRPAYLLARWQADRLAATYADLSADARYAQATTFFLTDIYGPKDYSRRDADGARVIAKMRALLPRRATQALASALHLNQLSQQLDAQMASMLFDTLRVDQINAVNYAEAYRRCDQAAARYEQIALVHTLGHELDQLVQRPLVQMTLKLAHGPAHLAGLGELQDFLERGFAAFLHMKGADHFLDTIRDRETLILERILAADPDPFQVFNL
ncbi:hypothetical protein [Chitinimonas sp. BJYL2]|uniref:FFLEELY motif protein n=1 Tax=Chitinimonas sp. BJYL2 TaxID=2976696 RepID=UPI0022B5D21F|nr:hypothetical protein [Chitinimonas sp. BJYL2]